MAKQVAAKPEIKPKQPEVTARQREIYEYLRELIVSRGYGPSVREIGQHFGITSPNGVTCHLKALEKKGLISREVSASRAIQLTDAPQPQAALPLIGQLMIGRPLELLPEPYTRLEFASLFASPSHCCLRIVGHGLMDDSMMEGDYLVIRRQADCRDGDLVLAIDVEGQTVVKRYYREARRVRLEAINRSRPPTFTQRATIVGLVVGVIRQF